MKPAKPLQRSPGQRSTWRLPTSRQIEQARRDAIHKAGIAQVRRVLEKTDVPGTKV